MKKCILLSLLQLSVYYAHSQCLVASTCGYTVSVNITPVRIIPSLNPCPFGYNYNVEFNYTVLVTGTNSCFNGNIGIQPQIICNSQSNGYFTINVPAPTVGGGSVNNTYTGTLTTTTNSYRSNADCATVTPLSLGCTSSSITIFGPGISNATVNCPSNSVLPVKLISFTGMADENGSSVLKWITSEESNNTLFIVEHSTDGVSFSKIGEVQGAGYTTTRQTYSFTHPQPDKESNYYRLKFIDSQNRSTFSPIVTLNHKNTKEIEVYPVPASSFLNVRSKPGVAVQLYSLNGKTLMALQNGQNNISHLAPGIYYVKAGATVISVIKQY